MHNGEKIPGVNNVYIFSDASPVKNCTLCVNVRNACEMKEQNVTLGSLALPQNWNQLCLTTKVQTMPQRKIEGSDVQELLAGQSSSMCDLLPCLVAWSGTINNHILVLKIDYLSHHSMRIQRIWEDQMSLRGPKGFGLFLKT